MPRANKLTVLGKVLIDVRAEDITRGERKRPSTCPVAHALDRRFPSYVASVGSVVATMYTCLVEHEPWRIAVSLPDEAAQFISAFDQGIGVSPMKFWAEVVAYS